MPKTVRAPGGHGHSHGNGHGHGHGHGAFYGNDPSAGFYGAAPPPMAYAVANAVASASASAAGAGPAANADALPPPRPPVVSLRASSGAWTPTGDHTLMQARAAGLNWAAIQAQYFPSKTANACRKRYERLMDRRHADDWEQTALENLAKEYMTLRREIWSPLASRTGQRWTTVETKCMAAGLRNLQSAARAVARRERLEAGAAPPDADHDGYDQPPPRDGGLALDGEYGGMQLAHAPADYGLQQRPPPVDMGIGAIVNRPPAAGGGGGGGGAG